MKEQGREDLSKYLDTNPFPPSYEIKLTDPSFAGSVADALQPTRNPAVRNVLDTKETAKNVKTVTDLMRTGGTRVLIVIGDHRPVHHREHDPAGRRRPRTRRSRSCGSSARRTRSSAGRSCSRGRWSGCSAPAITLGGLYLLADPIGSFMVDFFRVLPLSFGSLARDLVVIVTSAGLGLGVLGSWLSVRTYLIR